MEEEGDEATELSLLEVAQEEMNRAKETSKAEEETKRGSGIGTKESLAMKRKRQKEEEDEMRRYMEELKKKEEELQARIQAKEHTRR